MSTFRPYEPDQQLLLPPSLREWLPPDHLVWFISETVDQLDLGPILEAYREGGSGNLPYHPAMMLKILADAGYASEANLRALERRKIRGYVALGREAKRARTPGPRAHATRRMARTLRTKRGRTKYKQRKHVAEPPFGWMKRGLGFRQFSLRGLSKVTAEFKLLCLALNLRRMQHMMPWK